MNGKKSDIIEKLCEKLLKSGKTFATAESCTGGWIAKCVTDVPGVSSVFLGGVVSYSNEIKEKLLSVSHDTLLRFGAVSEQTATEMALGAVDALGADYAVAVTGIAGPGGATKDKPVGLVYISCADSSGRAVVERNVFDGDRGSVRGQTVEKALGMLSDFIG